MEYVKVIKPGLLTTVQDIGRLDYRHIGVSTSGAMDRLSYLLANILVGNDKHDACLEITLLGPKLQFDQTGIIAITGADLSATLNGEEVPLYTTIKVNEGDELAFGFCKEGARAYLAFAGGIDVPKVLGSRATFLRGKYGGFKGRALQADDLLPLGKRDIPIEKLRGRKLARHLIPDVMTDRPIRFILGPHDKEFSGENIANFLETRYAITNDSDRMGYRLDGPALQHLDKPDIISDFVTPGTIQVPGSQQPIIHMADCGTTGGYTKLGVIIQYDLPKVAQKKPGDTILFEAISMERAQRAWREQEEWLSDLFIANRILFRK